MKRFLPILIALIIGMNPLFPVVEYVVNYNYIVTKLCVNKDKPQLHCNGKCHLMQQFAKQAAADNDQTKQNTFTKTELPFVFVEPIKGFHFLTENYPTFKTITTVAYWQNNYTYLFTSSCLKPPKQFFIINLPKVCFGISYFIFLVY